MLLGSGDGGNGLGVSGGDPIVTTSSTLTPSAAFSGTDTFGYTVADPAGLTAATTVTITVD